jgi:pyruvate dehydrogenase E2 component (dihydrolipoamide acetyltransferase)
MAKLLEMPKLSPTMEEGQIGAWKKSEGDKVEVDELLAEVETDKATMEFRSFDKGTLLKILAPAGSVVKLGQPVAILGQPGEDISALAGGASAAPASAPSAEKTDPEKASAEKGPESAPEKTASKPEQAPTAPAAAQASTPRANEPAAPAREPAHGDDGRVKASPYVRKVARERGLSLVSVNGSGPNGRIVARDLEDVPAGAKAPPSRAPGELAQPEAHPMSMMRKTIARRLTESKQTVPHFYLTIDVDADPLHALRERLVGELAASLGDAAPKLSVNDFIVKAVAIALVRVPACNASFTPEALLFHKRVDVSVAVAVEDGLVTPVVRDADKKSLLAIGAEVRELAGRARQKKLRPEEMSNGTFSVSNLGMYGIDSFSAVINPPEGAILALGQIRREPVVRGEEIVPGRRLAMTLSCDHRVIDGAVGATFLKALRDIVEHPGQILLF